MCASPLFGRAALDLVEADPRGYLQLLKEFLGSLNGGSRGGNEQRTGELQPSLL